MEKSPCARFMFPKTRRTLSFCNPLLNHWNTWFYFVEVCNVVFKMLYRWLVCVFGYSELINTVNDNTVMVTICFNIVFLLSVIKKKSCRCTIAFALLMLLKMIVFWDYICFDGKQQQQQHVLTSFVCVFIAINIENMTMLWVPLWSADFPFSKISMFL